MLYYPHVHKYFKVKMADLTPSTGNVSYKGSLLKKLAVFKLVNKKLSGRKKCKIKYECMKLTQDLLFVVNY